MQRLQSIAGRLLYPPKWILLPLPPAVFTALVYIFLTGQDNSALAYPVYGLSAYSLTILLRLCQSGLAGYWLPSGTAGRYRSSLPSKSLDGIGMTVLFGRMSVSVRGWRPIFSMWFSVPLPASAMPRYGSSPWPPTTWCWVGCGLICFSVIAAAALPAAYRCYRRTAWLLFLLNLPMGGMILQMVRTDAGYSYPGYVIYLSALYAFYTVVAAIINLVKFRRRGNPILSAARALNFISAMMAILGLQTAMISRFSENSEGFRLTMNSVTGGAV